MTDCASRPCPYLCLESQDGCVPFEDKGFAVINRRGHDDSWSTGQSNCISDKVSQGHVEMEGQPPETSLTKWKWPRRLSLTDTRWVWWRRDVLCPSWRLADLGWVMNVITTSNGHYPSTQTVLFRTARAQRKLTLQSRWETEKRLPRAFPCWELFQKMLTEHTQ